MNTIELLKAVLHQEWKKRSTRNSYAEMVSEISNIIRQRISEQIDRPKSIVQGGSGYSSTLVDDLSALRYKAREIRMYGEFLEYLEHDRGQIADILKKTLAGMLGKLKRNYVYDHNQNIFIPYLYKIAAKEYRDSLLHWQEAFNHPGSESEITSLQSVYLEKARTYLTGIYDDWDLSAVLRRMDILSGETVPLLEHRIRNVGDIDTEFSYHSRLLERLQKYAGKSDILFMDIQAYFVVDMNHSMEFERTLSELLTSTHCLDYQGTPFNHDSPFVKRFLPKYEHIPTEVKSRFSVSSDKIEQRFQDYGILIYYVAFGSTVLGQDKELLTRIQDVMAPNYWNSGNTVKAQTHQ